MHWAHPQALLLLAFVPLAYWPLRSGQRGSARLPGLPGRSLREGGWAKHAPWILAHLRALSLIALVVALARPQTPDGQSPAHAEGIAIQFVVDTSLSMGYVDYGLGQKSISRLDAAKHAVRLFIEGDGADSSSHRAEDVIGLISFSRYPDVLCPLTTAHDVFLRSLDDLKLGPYTNIGDGLAWGIDRLRKATPQQKVLILLSDGKHNAPDGMEPLEAGRLAQDFGIRVYTIGAIGNQQRGNAAIDWLRRSPGTQATPTDSVDEESLQTIAAMTGGKYFRATDTEGLIAIHQGIDQLEKSRIEHHGKVQWREWYVTFLALGLVLLAVEQALAATRFLVVA